MSAHGAASLQRLSAPRPLSGSTAAPRPMSRGPSCALRPSGSMRQTLGSGTSGGNASGSGSRLRSCSMRALAGSEVSSSPAALASSTQGVVALCGPPPPVTSSLGGAGYAHSNMGGSNRPSSSSSSSSSSTSPESSSSADWNGAEEEPPLDHRSSATTSELLRAVLRRRAERLSRQEDPGLSAYLPASQPAQQQQQQQQQPPEQPPAPTVAQQQQSQQAQQQATPPPRYPLPSLASRNGAAHASTSSASQKGEGTARLQGGPAHLNGATAPSHSAHNGAGPPPQPQLKPVAAPEQRVVRQNAAGLVREDAVAQRKLAAVRFWLKFKAEWGQRLKVVGSHQELGGWALATAPELKWSQGDNWHTTAHLPAGGVVEYKYVLLDHSGNHPVAWQQGNNSVLALRPGDELVEVFDNWGADPGAKMVADGGQPITRENRLLSWASEMEAQLVSQKQDLRRSRMELASAQEEAREARLEAERFKAQLRAMEKEKIEAANHLHHARALNEALQSQLTDTTASFQEALRTAADILSQIDDVSPAEDGPAAALAAGAALAAVPPSRSFVAAEQAEALAVSVEGGDSQQAALQQASGADAEAWGAIVHPEPAPAEVSAEARHEQHEQLKAGLEAAAVADAGPHAAATDAASPAHAVAKVIEAAAPAAAPAPPSRSKGGFAFVPSTKRRRRSRNGKSKSSRK